MKYELVSITDIERMASAIAKSGLFGVKTPDQALALMLVAQAEGLHPAIAARDYDIINGKPAKKSEAMLRSFLEAGGTVEWHKSDDKCAEATFSHPSGGKLFLSWDMERAKAAGLNTKDVWKKYPRQMLRARLVSEGVRAVCPMATSGMYVPEEIKDMEKDVTPKSELPPPVIKPEPEAKELQKISPDQVTRLWAIATHNGWTNDDVHSNLKRTLNLDSVKDIPTEVYNQFCDYMIDYPKIDPDEQPFSVSHNPNNKQPPHGVV